MIRGMPRQADRIFSGPGDPCRRISAHCREGNSIGSRTWPRKETSKFLFNAAAELTDAGQRAAFLEAACGNDPSLRAAIEDLLRHDDAAAGFLSSPAMVPDMTSGATEPPPLEPLLARIGPYKLIEEIGDGGMGAVYMAQQTEPVKRLVALKIIKPGMDSRQVIARFEAERQRWP